MTLVPGTPRRRLRRRLIAALPCALSCDCGLSARQTETGDSFIPPDPVALPGTRPEATTAIRLRDTTAASGIHFRHFDGSTGRRYLIETMSAGVALFDYDGDGLIDIYFVNGSPIPPGRPNANPPHPKPRNSLYRNLGDGHFTDVTRQAGVGDTGFGLGVAAADYDNDGHVELFVSNAGQDVLYRNNGDGTFKNLTGEAGVGGGERIGAGVCFLDIEGDGDLDLHVANYVQIDYATHRPKYRGQIPAYPDPLDHPAEYDQLFRNNGDGSFTDISRLAGIASRAATNMGRVASDFDNDGDTDIFIANDVMANGLLENDASGHFQNTGIFGGTAYDAAGMPQSNLEADAADYDNDGWLDLHVASYQNELAVLYRNLGNKFFLDTTQRSGAGVGTLHHVTWGNGFADLDNDGDRDLFIACGHTDDNIELRDQSTAYKARNVVLMNVESKVFADVSGTAGDGLQVVKASRGAGLDDLANDRWDCCSSRHQASRSAPFRIRHYCPGDA